MSMGSIDLKLVGDDAFKDWATRPMVHHTSFRMTGLRDGTVEGNPVIMFGAEMPDGQTVVVFETTLRLLENCISALKARWTFEGHPYEGAN